MKTLTSMKTFVLTYFTIILILSRCGENMRMIVKWWDTGTLAARWGENFSLIENFNLFENFNLVGVKTLTGHR